MNWLIPLVVIAAIMLGVSVFFGTAFIALDIFLFALFAYLLLLKLNIMPKFAAFALPKKQLTWAVVGVGVVAFLMGGFAFISPILTYEGVTGAITGGTIMVPGSTATTQPTDVECVVSEELRGKLATVTVDAKDMAANAGAGGTSVDTLTYITSNGGITVLTDTTAGSLTSYSAGNKITFSGGNATYYVKAKTVCINDLAFPVELEAYAVASNTQTEITCYDKTGSAACSAATNNTQEDHTISLSAAQETTYYLELEEATANKAINLYGIGLAAFNDVSEVDLEGPVSGDGSSWSKAVVPEFMSTTTFAEDDAATGTNITGGFDSLYTRNDGPLLLLEFDSAKYKFSIKAGASDPTATTTFSSSDIAVVCFFDAVTSRGKDGVLYSDVHDHGDSEANVGMDEDIDTPVTAGSAADICHVMAAE
jgi:hypothetical protein